MFRLIKSRTGFHRAGGGERTIFDDRSYLDFYPDIAAAGIDPFTHYADTGWRERRWPSALFDVDWYIRQFPEGSLAGVNPLKHYVDIGGAGGRSPSPLFDSPAYLAFVGREAGPDFIPLAEFLTSEPDTDFNPCPFFDTKWFFQSYPHIADLDENFLLHFARTGARNGLDPSPLFRCDWYLSQNPDVAASPWNPLAHFLVVGQYEGRTPLPPAPRSAGRNMTPVSAPELIGAHEVYGEYSSNHLGDAEVIHDIPLSGNRWTGRLAVHLHIFYDDVMELMFAYLQNIHPRFSLYISVPDTDTELRARRFFSRLSSVDELVVRIVPNRGRDIAPMLVTFAEALARFDIVLHLHSKKSLHTDDKKDWIVQLLHHLLASGRHVDQLLGMFESDRRLGLVHPVYHPAIRDQIGWGSNLFQASRLLQDMGIETALDACPAFPAGSFFVARTSVLKPLWALGLGYDAFEEEDGAPDGGLAHAIERVLGLLPEEAGMSARQVRSVRPHSLSRAWVDGRSYHSALLQNLADGGAHGVPAHDAGIGRDLTIVVFSCATAGYDVPLPIEAAISGAHYRFYTDQPGDDFGLWQLEGLQFDGASPVHQARLHKTSPHELFPEADIAIWVDANIALTGDISPYIDRLLTADASFGLVRHPVRHSFCEEARALNRLGIEQADVLAPQIGQYLLDEVPDDLGLTETNFMIMDLRKPETVRALDIWRNEITRHSARDQISFDYARWKAAASSVWLFDEGGSVRSNPRFAYFSHGASAHLQRDELPCAAYTTEPNDAFNDYPYIEACKRAEGKSVDIVVPVFNAPEAVAKCLEALNAHRDALTRVILVDDGSASETADILLAHSQLNSSDLLIRHEKNCGYTQAANAGLRASEADVTVLLNSDAIVTAGAIRKLVAALERNQKAGLAGPLSNAATWQSVPQQVGPDGDYVVNELPVPLTLSDVAAKCDRICGDPHISVPALNGFCLAIRREVLETIGFLDDFAFPQGYGEETDYCYRAADRGFLLVIAADVFVFHSKSQSFGNEKRKELSQSGFQTLLQRYGSERLDQTLWELKNSGRLNAVRQLFRELVVRP